MIANGFFQNGYMHNEHLFLAAQQRLVYEIFQLDLVTLKKYQSFQKLVLMEQLTFFQMSQDYDSTGAILSLKYFENNFKIL